MILKLLSFFVVSSISISCKSTSISSEMMSNSGSVLEPVATITVLSPSNDRQNSDTAQSYLVTCQKNGKQIKATETEITESDICNVN